MALAIQTDKTKKMSKRILTKIFLWTGVIAYNFLFWQQKLGINLLIFSTLLGAVAFYLNPKSLYSKNAWLTSLGTLLTGVFVVVYNSGISKFMHITSFLIMLGFIHQSEMRSIYYSLLNSMANIIKAPASLLGARKEGEKVPKGKRRIFHYVKLTIIPVLTFLTFYWLYRGANPRFTEFTNKILIKLDEFWANISQYLSFTWLFFIVLGLFITAGIIYNRELQAFLRKDLSFSDLLKRIRISQPKLKSIKGVNFKRPEPFSMVSLKIERKVGIILIVLVNLMLIAVNIIDINWMWFGFEVPKDFSLKQFVHEGTILLIISILLSMGIILYLFRRNQNFYPGKGALKYLSYFWLFQNFVLSVSVFLRNYHYISYHGLAYKRIGVIVFLLLTAIGITYMFFKIYRVRSGYYLVRKNTWAAYAVLVLLACFNWEALILKYNLNHKNVSQIDVDFYLDLSDRAIPELLTNRDKVKAQMEAHSGNKVRWVKLLNYDQFMRSLENKKERYMEEQAEYNWPSWNLADHQTQQKLKEWDAEVLSMNK